MFPFESSDLSGYSLCMVKQTKPLIADLALVLVAFFWGTTFTVVKQALQDILPFGFLFLRFSLATLIIIPMIWSTGRFRSLPWKPGILAGAFLTLGYTAQTVGLQYTTASKSAFITGLAVVMVPIFVAVFEQKWLSKRSVIAVVIAVIGLYLLTSPGTRAFNRGDAWTVLCAVGFALHVVVLDYYTRRVDYFGLFFLQIAVVAFLSGAIIPFEGAPGFSLSGQLTGNAIFGIVVTAVFATAIAFFLQNWAQQTTTATRTALIFTLEPVFAALTAYVVLTERLGLYGILGGVLILTAIILAELGSTQVRAADNPSRKDETET